MLPPTLGAFVLFIASISPASTTDPVVTPAPPIPTVADARAYVLAQIGPVQYACLDTLWTRESGWDPTKPNPTSGAYGIPQALPGDRMATAGGDWRVNPVTQVKWGLSYIAGRYGSSCAALSHSDRDGWY